MKMIEAKKEIEEKLFVGAPLSLDAMMCALVAINSYIEQRGEQSSITFEINIPDDAQESIHTKAFEKLSEELQKGLDSGEREGWINADDIKKHLGLDEGDFL